MKTLDLTIRQMMLDWPTVHNNRALALADIFIGGRGHWDHTEPTRLQTVERAREHALESASQRFIEGQAGRRKNAKEDKLDAAQLKRQLSDGEDFYNRRVATIERVYDDFDATVAGAGSVIECHFQGMHPKKGGLHRGLLQFMADSEHGCEKAPADWVMGARETCALILACPFEETEDKNLARNKRIARKVLKALDKIHGPGETPDVSYVTWNEAHPFSETLELRANMKTYFADQKAKRKKKSA